MKNVNITHILIAFVAGILAAKMVKREGMCPCGGGKPH